MALVGNRRSVARTGAAFVGGSEAFDIRRLSLLTNLYASEAQVSDLSGVPNGYNNTGALVQPLKAGGMSSFQQPTSIVASNADAKLGFPITASGSLTLVVNNAQGDQIVALVASASLAITANANMTSAAALVGTGAAVLSSDVSLGGILPVVASASCAVTPSVTMTARAFMVAEAGGPTPLSPEGLASAVWSANLAELNSTGSTGEALANASSAGNPWDAEVSTNANSGSFGELVGKKLLKTSTFLGLK